MKPLSTAFINYLGQAGTNLAVCWRITRTDGQIFGYTNCDEPVTVNGFTYQSRGGFAASSIETKQGLNVDNLDLQALAVSFDVTESEIQAGRWDYAAVEIFELDRYDPLLGLNLLRSGTLGEFEFVAQGSKTSTTGAYKAELRGLMQPLQQTVGEVISNLCRASLGDARCKINLASMAVISSVAAFSGRTITNPALTQATGYFAYGNLTFTSGANTGLSKEVVAFDAGVLTLFEPMPYPVAVGDAFTVSPGCDRLFYTCYTRFNNAVNFRGEPHLPGQDKVIQPGR